MKAMPCDYPVEDWDENGNAILKFKCPFANSDDDYVSCRDYCGLGVDEDEGGYDYE